LRRYHEYHDPAAVLDFEDTRRLSLQGTSSVWRRCTGDVLGWSGCINISNCFCFWSQERNIPEPRQEVSIRKDDQNHSSGSEAELLETRFRLRFARSKMLKTSRNYTFMIYNKVGETLNATHSATPHSRHYTLKSDTVASVSLMITFTLGQPPPRFQLFILCS
jgi:hypothetical protein